MAMSQSQLYRKTTALTGLSCNVLLKEFQTEESKGADEGKTLHDLANNV
jgi:hypothetical protein